MSEKRNQLDNGFLLNCLKKKKNLTSSIQNEKIDESKLHAVIKPDDNRTCKIYMTFSN
jgi:hypothetical protein